MEEAGLTILFPDSRPDVTLALVQSGVILSEAKLTLARAPSKSWVYSDLVTLVGTAARSISWVYSDLVTLVGKG